MVGDAGGTRDVFVPGGTTAGEGWQKIYYSTVLTHPSWRCQVEQMEILVRDGERVLVRSQGSIKV